MLADEYGDALGTVSNPVFVAGSSSNSVPVQLYALLVDASGDPVLDAGGNTQVVEVGAEADGKLKINTSGLATETTLATLLTQNGFNTKADITLSALRDALKGSGTDLKTLFDIWTLLNGTLTTQLSGSILAEQLTNDDAVANVLTFSENISIIEIFHEELTWQKFTVNGVTLTVPGGGYRSPIGGTPAATVTIPSISCIVGRLI